MEALDVQTSRCAPLDEAALDQQLVARGTSIGEQLAMARDLYGNASAVWLICRSRPCEIQTSAARRSDLIGGERAKADPTVTRAAFGAAGNAPSRPTTRTTTADKAIKTLQA